MRAAAHAVRRERAPRDSRRTAAPTRISDPVPELWCGPPVEKQALMHSARTVCRVTAEILLREHGRAASFCPYAF